MLGRDLEIFVTVLSRKAQTAVNSAVWPTSASDEEGWQALTREIVIKMYSIASPPRLVEWDRERCKILRWTNSV